MASETPLDLDAIRRTYPTGMPFVVADLIAECESLRAALTESDRLLSWANAGKTAAGEEGERLRAALANEQTAHTLALEASLAEVVRVGEENAALQGRLDLEVELHHGNLIGAEEVRISLVKTIAALRAQLTPLLLANPEDADLKGGKTNG